VIYFAICSGDYGIRVLIVEQKIIRST